MIEFLDLILYPSACVNGLPSMGWDLNACIGEMFPQNDLVIVDAGVETWLTNFQPDETQRL